MSKPDEVKVDNNRDKGCGTGARSDIRDMSILPYHMIFYLNICHMTDPCFQCLEPGGVWQEFSEDVVNHLYL